MGGSGTARTGTLCLAALAGVMAFAAPAPAAKVERIDWHAWTNALVNFENVVRRWIGAKDAAWALHHLRVWGKTEDNCAFTSYGGDNARSFDDLVTGLELVKSRPILSKLLSEACATNANKVDCVAYTSDLKIYLGISVKGFDLSKTLITSSITIRVCADGTKVLEDEAHDP